MPTASLSLAARNSSIQSVVNSSILLTHQALNSGSPTLITGIKLEGAFLDAEQGIDNAKRVPLIDGSTIALINGATFGVLTLTVSRISPELTVGASDFIMSCLTIQKSGQNTVGGKLEVTYQIANTDGKSKKETWTFTGAVLMKCPPIKLAGNDVQSYTVTWSYDDYSLSVS